MASKIALSLLSVIASVSVAHAQQGSSSGAYKTDEDRRVSNSGLFIEPMILASREDSEIKTSQLPVINDDTSGRIEGAGLGLRLGGHVADVLFLAADARYNRSTFQDSFYQNATSTASNLGATLGVQTPLFGIRLWGTSVLAGEMDPEAGIDGLDLKFKDARGYRVGGGVHFAALAVNLEYEDLTYQNTDIQSYGILNATGSSDVDMTQRGTVVSLSFPFEL